MILIIYNYTRSFIVLNIFYISDPKHYNDHCCIGNHDFITDHNLDVHDHDLNHYLRCIDNHDLVNDHNLIHNVIHDHECDYYRLNAFMIMIVVVYQ